MVYLLRTAFVCFLSSLLLAPSISLAWPGKVVDVADGDTITVQRGPERIKIRLYGIDCPEDNQAFGENVKAFLSAQIFDKVVEIREMDVDRYKRIVAIVSVGDLNINRHLVEYGYAWVYGQYCKAEFCTEWLQLEVFARRLRRGLWGESNPVPPWEFRRTKKNR